MNVNSDFSTNPAVSYLRNPPNRFHAPYAEDGCTIFVKLRQFCAGDSEAGSYPAGTWMRSPRYSQHEPFTKTEGATIYVKTGHLDYEI
ncbi:MAG: hypothetical protein FJY60_03215 [Betaproteobacteria bacterium]|nr:hypothetical protein [Betaproteobacteria bacterium]